TDIIGELFKVLFKQQDWAAEDWGVDQEPLELMHIILSLGKSNAFDFQIVEQTRGDPDIGEQHGAGAGLDEASRFVGQEDEMYTPAFQTLEPLEAASSHQRDRLPDIKRNPQSDTSIKQPERLQDGCPMNTGIFHIPAKLQRLRHP
ncbi:unnamed protein product, partial [Symbiodinium sp. CCMP2592]